MQDKNKRALRGLAFLSLFVGLWNVAFVIGQASQNFFGTSFNTDWFSGLIPLSGLMLLLISLQLSGILKSENPAAVKDRTETLGARIVSFTIILAFGAFVLWFLWVKVFLTLLK